MTANSLHPSETAHKTAAAEVLQSGGGPQLPGAYAIDWRGLRRAGRACCCSAKPLVIAVMPPTANRPHPTELLLCGHHYRASRDALDRAGARVLDVAGSPVAGDMWSACARV